MKLLKSTAHEPRKASGIRKNRALVNPVNRARRNIDPRHYSNIELYRMMVRKRPTDPAWLHHYGALARHLGLAYDDAFLVVKAHVRKLRGNIRLRWVRNGLQAGYVKAGLCA